MRCKKPFVRESLAFGCGQCLPCLINRRRTWTLRIMLEALCHDQNSFVTLTYNNEHLPEGNQLNPEDFTGFIKRFRRRNSGRRIAYYYCGEYGMETNRPHYHAILFGASILDLRSMEDSWRDKSKESLGFVHCGDLTEKSAQYVAGYCTTKLTRQSDIDLVPELKNKHPEFARMSNRPAIGKSYIERLTTNARKYLQTGVAGDVPTVLNIGGKQYPLGRYLARQFREGMEVFNETTGEIGATPDETLQNYEEKLRAVWEGQEIIKGIPLSAQRSQALAADSAQARLNIEKRHKIFNSRRKL